ncbi:Uncharacterized protein PBTT_04359 [Plasmodiophora brassicae]|nr:hypothetical protein PBRA_000061 [Plasmodiophora brassicae]
MASGDNRPTEVRHVDDVHTFQTAAPTAPAPPPASLISTRTRPLTTPTMALTRARTLAPNPFPPPVRSTALRVRMRSPARSSVHRAIAATTVSQAQPASKQRTATSPTRPMPSSQLQFPDITTVGSTFTASLVDTGLGVDSTSWTSRTKSNYIAYATTAISFSIPSSDHRIVNVDLVPDQAPPQQRTVLSFVVLPRTRSNVDTDYAIAAAFRAEMQVANSTIRSALPVSFAGPPPVEVNITSVLVKVCSTDDYVVVRHPTGGCPASVAASYDAPPNVAAVTALVALVVACLSLFAYVVWQLCMQRVRRQQRALGAHMAVLAASFPAQYEPTISPMPAPDPQRPGKVRRWDERRALHAKAMCERAPPPDTDADWTVATHSTINR